MSQDSAALRHRLPALYPALDDLPAASRDDVLAQLAVRRAPAGAVLFAEGEACGGFPLVVEGTIRVFKSHSGGRSVPLYRVGAGDACVLTAGCLLGARPHAARGEAQTDVVLAVLPRPLFERLVAESDAFRRYVFGLFGERLADLMETVEAIAFQRLDQRLAAALLGHGARLDTTHQKLADEIGSVREMVTRLLNEFAARGLVELARGRIEIRDPAGLRALERRGADDTRATPSVASAD